jgi:hypothetical protein
MASVLFLNAGLTAALLSSRVVLAIVLGNALLPALRGENPVPEAGSVPILSEGEVVEFPHEPSPELDRQHLAMSA